MPHTLIMGSRWVSSILSRSEAWQLLVKPLLESVDVLSSHEMEDRAPNCTLLTFTLYPIYLVVPGSFFGVARALHGSVSHVERNTRVRLHNDIAVTSSSRVCFAQSESILLGPVSKSRQQCDPGPSQPVSKISVLQLASVSCRIVCQQRTQASLI